MFYRVRADLAFTEEDEAYDFAHDCEIVLEKASIINQGAQNEERGYFQLEKCYHDEDPAKPCELLDGGRVPYP